MTRVGVSGAGGKLATPIVSAVLEADDLELTALFNPNRQGSELRGLVVTGSPEEVDADVLVETAHPDAVFDNLRAWHDKELAVVVGTSGFTPERLVELREMWGKVSPCLVVPNFSIGAVLMMRFAVEASPMFEAVEIVETHHSTKPDAPSGTALATAMGIGGIGGRSAEVSEELLEGARGGDLDGVRIHSLRVPGLIARQEVVLSNPGEMFTIEHLSTSYESFAAGALLAIRGVRGLAAGVHVGLPAVMG